MPAVSVIIPTHNRLPMVLNAVESALAQTFGDREIIVADDGSTDGTAAALRQRFAERVRLISLERNSGLPAAARAAAIRASSGRWLAFLDSDDLWLPGKLEKQIDLLRRSGAAMAYAKARMADENLNPLGWDWGEPLPDKPFPALLNASCIPLSTVVLAREACDEAGGFDESPARRGIEDYDLWLRVAARRRLAFLDEVVAIYRQHERSVTALEGFLHPALIAYYESLDERIPGWRILAPGFPLRRKLAELHVRIGRLALEREGGGGEARRHLRAALRLSPLVVLRMGRRLVSHALLGDRLGRAIGGWREERRKAKGINRDDFK